MSKRAPDGFEPETPSSVVQRSHHWTNDCSCRSTENLWYSCTTLLTLLMYTVAFLDLEPNPRGGVNYLTLRVQFYANECNEGRDANP